MADRNKPRSGSESGEVMLEGMIVMVITMFMLIWILALGFMYYQRFCTTIIANDAAEKTASTFEYPSTDIVMGYITPGNIASRGLYRHTGESTRIASVMSANEMRTAAYIKYRLEKVNFAGVVDKVYVSMKNISDSSSRRHIEITVECSYHTPFGEIFNMFGMDRDFSYKVVSYAERIDYTDSYAVVDLGASLYDGRILSGTGFVESLLKVINTLIKAVS